MKEGRLYVRNPVPHRDVRCGEQQECGLHFTCNLLFLFDLSQGVEELSGSCLERFFYIF
ncbi:hypothetical protein [Brachymonas sp.]|uniref:hypothetical protein n=1 Tax=Brachymonas sp. TaxID=1936292 RepID=UPI0035AF93AD